MKARSLYRKLVPKEWPVVLQSYINGGFRSTSNPVVLPKMFPSTGEKLFEFQVAGQTEVEAAIESAVVAQEQWARFSNADRSEVLRKIGTELAARNDEIAQLETLDTSR